MLHGQPWDRPQVSDLLELAVSEAKDYICVSVKIGSGVYNSTLVASAKLRLTLRGPRFRGRYLAFGRVAGLHQSRYTLESEELESVQNIYRSKGMTYRYPSVHTELSMDV